VGLPLIVTAAEGNLIQELGGKPALRRLEEMFNGLNENERLLVNQGLHIGRVIDEHKVEFGTGDFLIRAVLGADQRTGSLAIGDNAPVGSTVQFQVRDAESADEDLRLLVEPIDSADGALVFTCNGRGSHLFEHPDHDAAIIADLVRREAVAGMFCAGEIGPVGEHSFLHGFTASAAIFRD
jgi:small ligand-binding sensory domain FIST